MMRMLMGVLSLGVGQAALAGDFETDKLVNWHHWRGPNANGSAPKADPPTRWDERTNIKWKVELPDAAVPLPSFGATGSSSSLP